MQAEKAKVASSSNSELLAKLDHPVVLLLTFYPTPLVTHPGILAAGGSRDGLRPRKTRRAVLAARAAWADSEEEVAW